ncbi:amino acid/amide ABC transporter membrane protein 2, HAAT family [Desulfocicer vacuolatum DSM 3385]|uniref:Amino acid/amide ABC transporter membrane protein 2, HAAT family n=1 Tax=Desulfocicer vacuolatum DSM 3385 TaxID=1121400 RepID=A0A1W2BQJ4_9BACT|nr:branched-chain amino acid ABC transporter permease [Desulfocicer vacuolatum]SMC75210.1 amino acid/amide ABC transporter membrane protein 2, HAAT family [Desulfocicer vacuolatum DSM 3385]
MEHKRITVFLAIIWGVVAILPLFFGSTNFIMHILIMCLIWSVVASCWDLIMGFAGIFSFGQVAFFVIGSYSSAIISARLGVPPVFSVFIAGIFTAGLGVLVGLPCLKLKGAYIALVTFAVHMILEPVLKGDIGRALGTGGARGILTIAPMNIFGYTFTSSDPIPYFYLLFLVAVVCSVIILMVIKSHWGTAFLALKDAEEFASCLGVSAFKYKLMVFALTSFLTGMIGGFYAHYVGMLSTRMLGIDLFVTLMIILVIGGVGKFPGAVIGAFITIAVNEMLSPLGSYRPIILGGLVVVLVLALPDGITGLFEKMFSEKKQGLSH